MNFRQHYITEVTAEEKYNLYYKNKLDRNLFNKALTLDPTSSGEQKVGKYVDWIIKNKAINTNEIKDYLIKYEKFKTKLEPNLRDINKLSVEDLVTAVENLEKSGGLVSKKDRQSNEKVQAEKESKIVFNDEEYVVIVPETEFASQYYGAGADWCTARRENGRCLFNSYNNDGTLYIIQNKSTKKKWQLWISDRGSKVEYKDFSNKDFSPIEEFEHNEKMMEWLDSIGVKNTGVLSNEDVEELAEAFLDRISFEDEKLYKDAKDAVKNYYSRYQEYDEPISDIKDKLYDEQEDLEYMFDKAMNYIENKYYIDVENDNNKLNFLFWLDNELDYSIKQDEEMFMERHEWVYTFDKPIDDVADTFTEPTNDIDWDYLQKYLEYNYNKDFDNKFDGFYDNFITSMKEYGRELEDDEKEKLKDLIKSVEAKMYSKSGHPVLDLNSIQHKAERYL